MALEPRPPKKNTSPQFVLTRKTTITISRATMGAWVNSRWQNGNSVDITIQANVQPLRFHEIMQLPESDRTKEWIKIYSAEEMYTSQESAEDGRQADIIHWEGKTFKVMMCRHFKMGTLDHFHSYAAREPLSAL